MFGYYMELALRSLKRSRALTALMILAIALGIGACMTTLTVLHVLSGDPLPGHSASVFYPQLDPRDMTDYEPGTDLPDQVTWVDGMNLLRSHRADRQALMVGGQVATQTTDQRTDPFFTQARYTTADFFPMFDTPFRYGHAWSAAEDDARSRVAVISSELNDRLFNGEDSTGRTVRADGNDLRVIGVLKHWRPVPHFFDLNMGNYSGSEDVYVPLGTARDLHLARMGGISCWGKGSGEEDKMETAECTWLQFWVQLDSPAKASAYRDFLTHYAQEQKAAGRFQHRRVIVEQPDSGSRFNQQSLTKPGAHRGRRSSGIVNCRAFLVRSLRGIIPPASATSIPLAINRSAASAGFFPYKPVSTSADK